MAMRLWHQSFTQLDRLPGYKRAIEEHLKKVAAPDTEIVLHGMDDGTYETEYPGIDIRYSYVQYMHTLQIFEHAIQAERESYDGFLLNTMPDPGLQEARTLVDIPVVGYGFSAMHTAAYLGQRFGIVCFIEPLATLYAANARKYGFERSAGPVRPLGLTFHDVVAGYENPAPVVTAFTEVVRGLAREGVDVVIPGEAPLALLLQRAGVHRIDDVVVVDTLATSVKMAEMLVSLRRTSGMQVTRQGYLYDKAPQARVEELIRYYRGKSV
jgi:allantoin racemase